MYFSLDSGGGGYGIMKEEKKIDEMLMACCDLFILK